MPEYQWARGNGEIVTADYNRNQDALSDTQVQSELLNAFQQFGHVATCAPTNTLMPEVYTVTFQDPSLPPITVCAKGMTPGGRANLTDEQRIQQKSRYINYTHQQLQSGHTAVHLGVYRRDNQTVFCAWKLKPSAADPDTPISRQIKINTIAQAMKEGFAQQEKGAGEYACAFRKEFIYFYLRHAHWLHDAPVTDLFQFAAPLPDEDAAEPAPPEPPQAPGPAIFSTGLTSEYPRNRILFGAPGTGKSFTLNLEKDALLAAGGEYERVTFHPDYSYANFVGTYKPVPCTDSDGNDAITYAYVPGPFMRIYVKALLNARSGEPKPFLLMIEEINRASVAAVFGDVFQLLDRGDDEVSEYPIQASEDVKQYLSEKLGGTPDNYSELRIPDNMFIWATMNSADQGVFPMDTAFKRRWDFTYLDIDGSEAGVAGKRVVLGQGEHRRVVEWNALRKAINRELLSYKVNEDKLLGPYFISKKHLPLGDTFDPADFIRIFKNKIIMYLFDDAAKQRRAALFGGCDESSKNHYSAICREFDSKGVFIFCETISSRFIDLVPEDGGV